VCAPQAARADSHHPTPHPPTQLAYLAAHPSLWRTLGLFALTSAAGQLFIFHTIRTFDSLVLTTITTTRKFFTIVLSVVMFGHVLNGRQWGSVGLVFFGLVMDAYYEEAGKRAKRAAKAAALK
jgi:UDP-galactose transporter B1